MCPPPLQCIPNVCRQGGHNLVCYWLTMLTGCLQDAGIPSGPVVEIMHYLECSKQLGRSHHHHTHHFPRQQQHSHTPTTPPLSAATPTSAMHRQHYFFPPPTLVNSSSFPSNTQQQQAVVPYQPHLQSPTSYAIYSAATPPEGVSYTGRATPLPAYQIVPPPAGKKALVQHTPQQQREVAVAPSTSSNVGSPATGQLLQQNTDSLLQHLPSSLDTSAPAFHPAPETVPRTDVSTAAAAEQSPAQVLKSWPSSSSSQSQPPETLTTTPSPTTTNPRPQTNGRRPVTGFGRINCVVCGAMDHVTYNCSQRNKFFTHM